MVMICSVCKVEQLPMNSHLIFHRLPKDPDVQKQWLKILKKDNVKALVVCSNHFKPEDYRELCDRPILKKDAIPRLGLCELSTSIQSTETMECLKRKNDSSCDGSSIPSKKRCYLKDFGTFRKEDFKNENSWNRFLVAFKAIKKDKLLLQRKNERLFTKVKKFKDMVQELKEKNLLTSSVANMLNVS